MSSLEKIEQLVLQLTKEWFESKRNWFEKEPFYCKKKDRIFEEWEEYNLVWDESNELIELPPKKCGVNKSLNDYSWSGYYPHGLYEHEEEIAELPQNASVNAEKIVAEITSMLQGIVEVKTNHYIILAAIESITDGIDELQVNDTSDDYTEFLSFFLLKTKKMIYVKYGYIKRAYMISEKHEDKLLFKINQEKLAALMYLLYEADFLSYSAPRDFYDFCCKYFHFPNQKKNKLHTPAKDFGSKYNDVINDRSTKAKHYIITKLKEAFMK